MPLGGVLCGCLSRSSRVNTVFGGRLSSGMAYSPATLGLHHSMAPGFWDIDGCSQMLRGDYPTDTRTSSTGMPIVNA